LGERDAIPLAVWDGKVRMSIAGVQDKLMVYLDRSLDEGGRMFLAEPPLASTHILKPEPGRTVTTHLVVNEHFCMSLAKRMGLPVAEVSRPSVSGHLCASRSKVTSSVCSRRMTFRENSWSVWSLAIWSRPNWPRASSNQSGLTTRLRPRTRSQCVCLS
jgi:hypothetical protein